MPDVTDEPLSCIMIAFSLPASVVQRLLELWQTQEPTFMQGATELGIIGMELFDHSHDEPDPT